jgi:hypothetical protein
MNGVTLDSGPAAPPAVRRPRPGRRWLVVAIVAWGLVVAGLGVWAVRHSQATIREQTTISQALTTADRAIADLLHAARASGTDVVAAVNGYSLVGDCRVTSVRRGGRWQREALLFVAPGAEPGLLDRIAAGLPGRYRARVRHGSSALRTLSADAGNFVAVRGGIEAPGQVRVSADTGCRPVDRPVREPEAAGADRAPVQAVLGRLGLTATSWRTHAVPCASGGTLWTVEGVAGPGGAPQSLTEALGATGPAVLARPEVYAYRSGPLELAVRSVDGTVTVTATAGCG